MENTSFRQRRLKLLSLMQDGVAIIPAAKEVTRSNDTEYAFRQDSHFKYLTGFSEPDAVLVLCQHHGEFKDILFVRPKDKTLEMWMGTRMGVEHTKDVFDFDEVHNIEEFDKIIETYIQGHKNLYLDFINQKEMADKVHPLLSKLTNARRTKRPFPTSIINVANLVGKLRLTKDVNEVQAVKTAVRITKEAHKAAMSFTEVGKNENDVYALIKYIFNKNGAKDEAYSSIVAGGVNANILHYISNDSELNDNELLLIDAGSEYGVYASDITRTFPVNGKFTQAQKEIYQLVLQAQKDVIAICMPGKTITDLHNQACKTITKGLIELEVLSGDLEENLKNETFKKFFPHGTSHWLGIDVHDQCPYKDNDFNDIKLSAGMLFTVEPGLYFQTYDTDYPMKYAGIGIRIEDNILITETGHENLSAAIPKELKEVEEQCSKDWRSYLE